jgi:deazaflavin-dependent oxidoreductase (nitroreductase family)
MTDKPLPDAARPTSGFDLPRRLAIAFGPVSRPLAGRRWFRLWGVLHHVGRSSGTPYATPVVARRIPGGFIIPLPFGERTQWLRNLDAAGSARIRWNGGDFQVVEPRVVALDDVLTSFRPVERAIMRRARSRFVRVDDSESAAAGQPPSTGMSPSGEPESDT